MLNWCQGEICISLLKKTMKSIHLYMHVLLNKEPLLHADRFLYQTVFKRIVF